MKKEIYVLNVDGTIKFFKLTEKEVKLVNEIIDWVAEKPVDFEALRTYEIFEIKEE